MRHADGLLHRLDIGVNYAADDIAMIRRIDDYPGIRNALPPLPLRERVPEGRVRGILRCFGPLIRRG
jgi:hypothetical protein